MTSEFGDPAAVTALGQNLTMVAAGLSAVAGYLTGRVNGLVPRSWYGHGAETFAADWAGRARRVGELADACRHAGGVLTQLGGALADAEAQAARAQHLVPPYELGRGLDPAGQQQAQQMLAQAQQAARQARQVARARLAGIALPRIGPPVSVAAVNAWAQRLWHLPPTSVPWYEIAWHDISSGAQDVGGFIAGNAGQLAQLGLGTAETLGGGLLALLGAGGELGGLALDATGIGAVAGVPAGAVSTTAIAAGLAAMAAGAGNIGEGASHLRATSAAGAGGGPTGGTIDQSQSSFNPNELKIAEKLSSEGEDVTAVPRSTAEGQKTPDALVNGVPTEFKTLDPGASSLQVSRTLQTAQKQAASAVVDARGSGLTQSEAELGIRRYLGANPGRMTYIRIIGDGFGIQWP